MMNKSGQGGIADTLTDVECQLFAEFFQGGLQMADEKQNNFFPFKFVML